MNVNTHRWQSRLWLALVAAGVIGLGSTAWLGHSAAEDAPVPATAQNKDAQNYAKSLSRAFRAAAEASMPSVVTITSQTKAQQVSGNLKIPQGENPFKGTPFEDYFKDQVPRGFGSGGSGGVRMGMGAGVIIDRAGVILTNNHVVEGATEVTVRLADGREFEGYDIKTDKQSDLAIVHIKGADKLPVATLGDSDQLEIGDWVIAVGNPFNQELTVSAGIISGKGRSLTGGQRTQYLQTDAAINPGNSGGPLLTLDGEVVGINTAIATNSGGSQGVGFAIPINHAKWVVNQLTKTGSVKRAYMGVQVGDVSGDLAKQLGVHHKDGVLVREVIPGSPAAEAGLKEGDVITDFAGHHVSRPGELQTYVERTPIDKKEQVKVIRDGSPLTLTIGVKQLDDEPADEVRTVRRGKDDKNSTPSYVSKDFGFEVSDMTRDMAEQLGFKDHRGVVITHVDGDGLAAEKGLNEGMLVKKVGSKEVTNLEEFQQAMKEAKPERGVMLLVRAAEGNRFVVLKK
ncbi:MAG TPA: Do family serine endopeptidase [Pirellulales bacterium]|jgi:serine protease Do